MIDKLSEKYKIPEQDIAAMFDLTDDVELVEKGCKLLRRGWKRHLVLWFIRGNLELTSPPGSTHP